MRVNLPVVIRLRDVGGGPQAPFYIYLHACHMSPFPIGYRDCGPIVLRFPVASESI